MSQKVRFIQQSLLVYRPTDVIKKHVKGVKVLGKILIQLKTMAASSYSLNQQEIHYFIETRASVRSSKYRSKHQSDRGLHLPVTAYVYSSFVQKSYECSLKARNIFLTVYSSLLDTLVTEAPTIGSSDAKYKKVGDFLYTFSLQLIKLTNDRHLHGTVFDEIG